MILGERMGCLSLFGLAFIHFKLLYGILNMALPKAQIFHPRLRHDNNGPAHADLVESLGITDLGTEGYFHIELLCLISNRAAALVKDSSGLSHAGSLRGLLLVVALVRLDVIFRDGPGPFLTAFLPRRLMIGGAIGCTYIIPP